MIVIICPKINKPIAGTREEWKAWNKSTKAEHPVWYFFHEDLPPFARRFWRRFRETLAGPKDWIAYRTYNKFHSIRVDGATPGYMEKDDQMLYAMFGILVDFIEVEKAYMLRWCNDSHPRHKYDWLDRLFFWKDYRSAKDGLEHLDWEIGLVYDEDSGTYPGEAHYGKPMSQAISALEEKTIYLWYKHTRPNRPDNHDLSGWTNVCRDKESDVPSFTEEQSNRALWASVWIEELFHKEDEEMLKRLITIRRHLWT